MIHDALNFAPALGSLQPSLALSPAHGAELERQLRSSYDRFLVAKSRQDASGMRQATQELRSCFQEAKQAARQDAERCWLERRAAIFPHDPEAYTARLAALSYDLYHKAKREMGHLTPGPALLS